MNDEDRGTAGDILVVDDLTANLRVLVQILSEAGHRTRPAADGPTALRAVEASPPELILLDVLMPVMDGFEVCRRLKGNARSRAVPVIFVSAMDEPVDKVKGFAAGGVDYITKPFQPQEVLARVSAHLRLSRLQAQLARQNQELEERVRERTAALEQANHELLASRERLQSILDHTTSVFAMKDASGRYIAVNRQFERLFHVTRENVVGRSMSDVLPADVARRIQENDRKAMDADVPLEFEEQIPHDGEAHTYVSVRFPLGEAGSDLRAVCGIATDITSRKQTENELRRVSMFLKAVIEQAPFGIQICEGNRDNWELTTINREAQRIIGVTQEQHQGLGLADGRMKHPEKLTWQMFHPDGTPWHAEDAPLPMAMMKGKVTRNEEMLVRRADGVEHAILCNATPIFDDEGEPIGGMVMYSDLTERKRLEAQLRQAQKMEAIGQLAGGVAHDFNNILTAVLGHVELINDEVDEPSPCIDAIRENVREIGRGARRASELTRQLLTFSRRQLTRPEAIDLNECLRGLEKMLRRLIAENIELRFEQSAGPAVILADAGQLEQVVVNLAVNARDAMPDGGILTFATQHVTLDASEASAEMAGLSGPCVRLTVSDTGTGMAADVRDRVFEPFFTTKPLGQGTGLGLATVYGIVKQANGHISVYSEPGHGTTFRVHWPAATREAGKTTDARPATPPTGGTETILLCEDNRPVRQLAEFVLRDAGYTVLAAESATQALKLAASQSRPIDLLVSDVIMPDMNGRKLADVLIARCPSIRTLFMSGYTSGVIAHHGVLDAEVQFLEKPFSRAKLLARVREVLSAPAHVTNATH